MQLRRLTDRGIESFRDFLQLLQSGVPEAPPRHLLDDDRFSERISPTTECDEESFSNRMQLAAYLDRLVAPLSLPEIHTDVGLWSWLALNFFDQLCPASADGTRDPGTLDHWIPEVDASRRYYRHMLLGPHMFYQAHRDQPERAAALFCNPVYEATPEVFRLFIENPDVSRYKTAVAVATRLYYNARTGRTKRGTGRKTFGGCRRLIKVLRQFDCTYDLETLTPTTLLSMLPSEFAEFQ